METGGSLKLLDYAPGEADQFRGLALQGEVPRLQAGRVQDLFGQFRQMLARLFLIVKNQARVAKNAMIQRRPGLAVTTPRFERISWILLICYGNTLPGEGFSGRLKSGNGSFAQMERRMG